MKIEKRKPKFKLGQVVTTHIGFRGVIISIKGKGNIKYIVSIDGNFGDHKISEKKLLKFNPEIKKECPISVIDEFGEFTDKMVESISKRLNVPIEELISPMHHKESRYVDAMESMGFIPCAAERFRKQAPDASAEKPKEPENVTVNDPFDSACTAFIKMSKKFKKNTKGFRVGDLVEIISTGVRMFVSDTTFYSDTEDLFVNLSPSPRASSVIDRIESHKLRLIKRNED